MGGPGPAVPADRQSSCISSSRPLSTFSSLLCLCLSFFVFSLVYCLLPLITELSYSFFISLPTFSTENSLPSIQDLWFGPAFTNRFRPPSPTLLLFWSGLVVLHFTIRLVCSTFRVAYYLITLNTTSHRRDESKKKDRFESKQSGKIGRAARPNKMATVAMNEPSYSNETKSPTSNTPFLVGNQDQYGITYDSDSNSSTSTSRRRMERMGFDLEGNDKLPWGPKKAWSSVYLRLWVFLATLVTLVM